MPPAIPLSPVDAAAPEVRADETLLPHWGLARRSVHRLCRRSRTVNTIVAAMEMRLGREELLSLPQYMAVCPTGQCNALCDFCSVTRNRTGIIKKQLPFDAILRFTAPVARVIRMYGLEGNGEPTLYERFDDLAASFLRNGSTAYLITNGDRLTAESIDALVAGGLDAVNFSLNAATAPTHRRVMKLKDFERVLANIRHFVRARGRARTPVVSISMVVTRDNVHEVVDFIRLGEEHLGVDRVLVRPLSEIATELGAVEDVRPLVPFESEIVDMLDGVRDYLRCTPRRSEIEIAPENFRAVRPDPPGILTAAPEHEGRFIAPRPAFWDARAADAVTWTWNAVEFRRAAPSPARILESVAVPVAPDAELRFRCRVAALHGALTLSIGPPGGAPIASAALAAGQTIDLPIATGTNRALALWLESGSAVEARLEFDRLRTPAAVRSERFALPHQGRWEIASPGVQVEWNDTRVRVRGRVTAGPYLLKSYSTWCAAGTRVTVAPRVTVAEGALGIGVLSADQQQWLATCAIQAPHEDLVPITFETGANDRVHFVLYGAATGELDGDIDWDTALEPMPSRHADARAGVSAAPDAPQPIVVGDRALHALESTDAASVPGAAPTDSRRTRLTDRIRRAIGGDVRYYCQKPWTDLHNFTVDGRMDVCCIATGESQARYALGNLVTQSFQEVWNGARMREFRRTVNSGSPLPPCQRCPMAFAYQGPLFNPAGAERRVRKALAVMCRYLPFGSRVYRAGDRIFPPLVSHLFFRGFKR